MADSGSHQVPTFHFEEDAPSLDPSKKWKLYSSISSLSSIKSIESQSTFTGTTNELVTHLRSRLDRMQKETFTRMCNKHLNSRDQITDLFVDFRDGLVLLKLLQKLSNKTVAKPAKGNMRIHHMQNLTVCVRFLIEHKVYLNKASISAENIAEGDERRTLGMIFMIFLRFMFTGTDLESHDYKGKKAALLLWCQHQTESYANVNIKNFTSSWQGGLALNALIHRFRPDLIQYNELDASNPIESLNNAFNVAQIDLEIPRLLDAEDVVEFGDERSMFFYVYSLYQYFNQGGRKTKASDRLHSVLRKALEFQRDSKEYETSAQVLVTWMEKQEIIFKDTDKLKDCNYDELISLLDAHKLYIEGEKGDKLKEEIDLFTLYSELMVRAKSFNFTPYQAPPGLIPQDIDFQFGELTSSEHSYRLKLFLCLRQKKEIEKFLRKFDERANILNNQLKERNSEIPITPSTDIATCQSQLDKLTTLYSYIDTFPDRLTPLENTTTTLKSLKYTAIQSKIKEKDQIDSVYNNTKQVIQDKQSLFRVNIQYYVLKQSYEEISPRVNTIKDTFMKIQIEGLNTSLSEDPTIAYTEIQVFEIVIDENVSGIIQYISILEKISRILHNKEEVEASLQSLLAKFKQLRELIQPTKEHLFQLLEILRKRNELSDPVQIQKEILQISKQDLEKLNFQLSQLKTPNYPNNSVDFLRSLGEIHNNSLTVQKRVEALLQESKEKSDLVAQSQELIDKCDSNRNSYLNDGWLLLLIEELDEMIAHLTHVKGRVNHINRQANEGVEIGQTEIDSLDQFEQDISNYADLLKSMLVGCAGNNVALPPCPDFTDQPEVKAKTEKIESLLKYILSLIHRLVDRASEQMKSRERSNKMDPKYLRKFLTDKQEMLDQMPLELDLEGAKVEEDQLKEIASALAYFEESQSPDEETLTLLSKLKKAFSEKEKKNKNALNKFELKSKLEAGNEYLQNKSKELDKMADNISTLTEVKLEIFKDEIEKFQEIISTDFTSQIQNLIPGSRKECETLKDEIDSECNHLYDRIKELLKKVKDRERYQNLMKEADKFLDLCDNLNKVINLDLLNEDQIPSQELRDLVVSHDSSEKQVSEQKPVFERLTNELYHSGNADGREKGKEVQKKWQILQQTFAENSKNSRFIAMFLKFLKETIPLQNLINRLNSNEIPELQNQISKDPDFEETQVLSVKSLTLLHLIKYISDIFNSEEKAPIISKYKSEANSLISADKTARILTPRITLLEKTIAEALSNITELNSVIKCWLKYYVIKRRANMETNWAKGMQPGMSEVSERKLSELTNWSRSMQEWVTDNSSLDEYKDYPDDIRSKIISTLEETNENLTDLVDEATSLLNQGKANNAESYKIEDVKYFEDKLDSLADELEDFQSGEDLVDNNKKVSYISGLPNLLLKLEKEIKEKHPKSTLLSKIPELEKQIEDLNSKLKDNENWLNLSIQIDDHTQLNRDTREQLDQLIPLEKCDLSQLQGNKYKLKVLRIGTKPCENFLEELSHNPDVATQPDSFQEKLRELKNLNAQLIEKITLCEQKIPKREETLDSELKLTQSLESLDEIEFILSISPEWNGLTILDQCPQVIAEYVLSCDQNLELNTKRNEIVLKSKDLTEKLIGMMSEYLLEYRDKEFYIGVIEYFKNWLKDILKSFMETASEQPKHSTVAVMRYFGFVLTDVATEYYGELLRDCPSNIDLSEEVKDVWPLRQMFVSDNIQKIELSLKIYMLIIYIRESANRFSEIQDRIPKPDSFKTDIPLAKISPTICNNSLVTAGSIYSENSKKYQALTGNKLTTIQSTELLTGMQTLSQTYHELVETCRSVLLVAKSVIVRDPIVKTVRMLEKSNNELDQKIEEISKQDSLPDDHSQVERELVTQAKACGSLPLLLAASQDPENSLSNNDIEDIQNDSLLVTKSLNSTKDVWSQTKVFFSRKEILKKMEEKELECRMKSEKLEDIDQESTLDFWEKWCQDSIDKLLNMEVTEHEVIIPNNELVPMESSLTPSKNYSISDFTVADTSAFDLDLSLQPDFADTYNLLHSITEESYEDYNPEETLPLIEEIKEQKISKITTTPFDEKVEEIIHKEVEIITKIETPFDENIEVIIHKEVEVITKRETLVYETAEGIIHKEVEIITKIETPFDENIEVIIHKEVEVITKIETLVYETAEEIIHKEVEFITEIETPVDDKVEEIFVEVRVEQVKTFDLSRIANLVYTQEPIDGDPARPSPVHRTLDVGDDSDDDSCYFEHVAIEEVVMSEGATYLKERNEYEGLSKVREVFVKEEVSVVENPFDFSRLLREGGKKESEYLEQKEKHVSFNEEDVVIRFKKTDILSTVHKSGKTIQGFLTRKQEYISENRKPLTRPWKEVFVVLTQNRLEFYKDPIEMTVSNPLYPDLNLSGATCEVPSDYTKKEFVFRIVSATGASFLFQARNSESLLKWLTGISQSILVCQATRAITRTQSLDLSPTRQRELMNIEEAKRMSKLQKFLPKK